MTRRNSNPLSCLLDENGPESIHRAVTLAQEYSAQHAPAHMPSARLAILIEELVTNLYDHGAVGEGFSGELVLDDRGDGLLVTLRDSGAPFDPRQAAELDMPNTERGGGVGLAMIRAWADVLDYRREGAMNRLDLRMRL
jgi:serine/threonine-protein kinase RsbW